MRTNHRKNRPSLAGVALTLTAALTLLVSAAEAQQAAAGVSLVRAQRIGNQNIAAFPAQANDHFGWSLAGGDFNGDGYDDLAIGVPREEAGTTGGDVDSGEVKVAYGAPGGFDLLLSRRFTQDVMSGGETSQLGDRFGAALAVGDFKRDGHDDLAIGAPYESADGLSDAGAQTILYGSLFADGFETQNAAVWSSFVP